MHLPFNLYYLFGITFLTNIIGGTHAINSTFMETTENANFDLNMEETDSQNQQMLDSIAFLKELNLNIMTYVPPVLWATGLVGNTLTIIVLRR